MDYSNVLNKIKPDDSDSNLIKDVTDQVVLAINNQAKIQNIDLDIVSGGSTAKGTFLKGNFDVDIFVRFKNFKEDYSNKLQEFLEPFAKEKNINLERVHGSRDYFNFLYENLFFEIVPVKYIEKVEFAENVTDMSPMHVFWVQNFLTDKLRDEIRLAKQFCKANNIYGAESYIKGISGHVLDILVIYYGGFENFLKSVVSWKNIEIVDPENKHLDVFKEMNSSKLQSPLVVVDPVDSQRNAAAAVSVEKFELLKLMAKNFLKNPNESFFEIEEFNIDVLLEEKKETQNLFLINIKPLIGKKDVVVTKVLKVYEFLLRELNEYGFNVEKSNWYPAVDVSYVYFFIDSKKLESEFEREGPPLLNEKAVENFKLVHVQTYEKNNRVYTKIQRKFLDASSYITNLLSKDYVVQRISSYNLKSY